MDITTLLDLEHRGWLSLCDGTGGDVYGELMSADGVMVLAQGAVFDRQQVVDSLNEAPPWGSYEITEPRLVELGDDAAVLVYRGRARRDDGTDFEALMTSAYVRRGEGWALGAYTQTPIPS